MAKLRDRVVKQAREYLGVPFRHEGRTRHGLDCVGLGICVAHDLALSNFDIKGYSRVPSGRRMERLLAEQCTEIDPAEAKEGDLLHLSFEKEPQHLAIITDQGIIHADNYRGVVEHRLDSRWRHRIRGAYRLPGVE